MRIAFYGSSLLSSYWNGAATYYRGLLADLARRGHRITFYEPDAFDRQRHRDMDPPGWAEARVWPATEEAARAVIAEAASADIVVKASGVGVFDDALLQGVMQAARPEAIASSGTWTRRRPSRRCARRGRSIRCAAPCRGSTWC